MAVRVPFDEWDEPYIYRASTHEEEARPSWQLQAAGRTVHSHWAEDGADADAADDVQYARNVPEGPGYRCVELPGSNVSLGARRPLTRSELERPLNGRWSLNPAGDPVVYASPSTRRKHGAISPNSKARRFLVPDDRRLPLLERFGRWHRGRSLRFVHNTEQRRSFSLPRAPTLGDYLAMAKGIDPERIVCMDSILPACELRRAAVDTLTHHIFEAYGRDARRRDSESLRMLNLAIYGNVMASGLQIRLHVHVPGAPRHRRRLVVNFLGLGIESGLMHFVQTNQGCVQYGRETIDLLAKCVWSPGITTTGAVAAAIASMETQRQQNLDPRSVLRLQASDDRKTIDVRLRGKMAQLPATLRDFIASTAHCYDLCAAAQLAASVSYKSAPSESRDCLSWTALVLAIYSDFVYRKSQTCTDEQQFPTASYTIALANGIDMRLSASFDTNTENLIMRFELFVSAVAIIVRLRSRKEINAIVRDYVLRHRSRRSAASDSTTGVGGGGSGGDRRTVYAKVLELIFRGLDFRDAKSGDLFWQRAEHYLL